MPQAPANTAPTSTPLLTGFTRYKHLGSYTAGATSLSHEVHHRAAQARRQALTETSHNALKGLTTPQRLGVLGALVTSRLMYGTETCPPHTPSQLTHMSKVLHDLYAKALGVSHDMTQASQMHNSAELSTPTPLHYTPFSRSAAYATSLASLPQPPAYSST